MRFVELSRCAALTRLLEKVVLRPMGVRVSVNASAAFEACSAASNRHNRAKYNPAQASAAVRH